MVWTVPKTWVANTRLVDADLNAHIRDNIAATMPGLASAEGDVFVSTALNTIAARTIAMATASATVVISTGDGNFRQLTGGPEILTTTGTRALCMFGSTIDHGTSGTVGMTVRVEGFTSSSEGGAWEIYLGSLRPTNTPVRSMSVHLFTGLPAGSNRFVAYYRGTGAGNTATFSNRFLIVFPL